MDLIYLFRKSTALCLMLVFHAFFAFAQQEKTYEAKYAYGKSLYDEGKFQQALAVFKSIANTDPKNSLKEYAYYFYALSAHKSGDNASFSFAINVLTTQFTSWNKIDEAYYLKSVSLHESGKSKEALQALDLIKNSSLTEQANQLRLAIYDKMDKDSLLALFKEKGSSDKLMATALLPKLDATKDPALQKQLKSVLGLKDSVIKANKKASYNIGVVMPFLLNSVQVDAQNRPSQAIFDLYAGMKIAQKQLADEGTPIELFAFDNERDSLKTASIFKDKSMLSMDLVVGPIFRSTIPVAANFSNTNKKVMVNPLSSNANLIQDNPNTYLMLPTYDTQARQAALFARDSLKADTVKVIFGMMEKDSLMAVTFKKTFEDKGGRVTFFKGFHNEEGEFNKLVKSLSKDRDSLHLDSKTCVFVSTTNRVSASNIYSALRTLRNASPIITLSEWLEYNQITFEELEQLKVYLIHPQFVDNRSPEVKAFNASYVEQTKLVPSIYAYSGYETVYQFGKLLHEYGPSLSDELGGVGFRKGKLFPGIKFSGFNDNQVVPIVKFVQGDLSLFFGQN